MSLTTRGSSYLGKRARLQQGLVSTRAFSISAPRARQRLVILGSGWGGYEVLRGVDKKAYDVTVVSPNNYFNFTPLLASCAVGTLEFRSAIEPVRRYCPQVTAYQAWCDSIDFKAKTLRCMPATPPAPLGTDLVTKENIANELETRVHNKPFNLHYDKLVIAVGAYSQTFNVPGVKEHAHFLKDIKDARVIRARVLECFEQASQPTISDDERRRLLRFCIVGGGPTGVEFAAELHDLLGTDVKRHFPTLAKLARITLLDVAPSILGSFDRGLQDFATKKFNREGIQLLTKHHVERVEAGKLFTKEEGEIPFGMLVWSTGLAPNPLVQAITDVEKNPKNHSLITSNHLNVISKETGIPNPDVFAIGDAAMMKEHPLPATAQVAYQKAKYMTKKLNALSKDQQHLNPFEFRNAGSLAYLGDWQAVYDATEVEHVNTSGAGRTAWLLWRSAYFTRTVSIRNKILVPVYWFMNWIFGRDLSRF
ncbi:NDE1, mitochondrial external NADH dehydrogenase [Abortiporus biennis]|nr:NDE1, mitochondrial external NADH dehydrogenase [Abortiporus biennis]